MIVLLTRLTGKMTELGNFALMLFVFFLLFTVALSVNIVYPGMLILIATGLVALIFTQGPEWSELYFGRGDFRAFGKMALIAACLFSLMFGVWIYLKQGQYTNPVPTALPLDALVIVGIGFAFYVAIMEETLFRSFFFQRASSAAGPVVAIFTQGIVYGMMYSALPFMNGPSGMMMGAIYGCGLGVLVHKSNSIYLAIFVHFIVSLITFIELSVLGRMHAA